MFIKPNDGIRIRDPYSLTLVPPEGKEVSDTDLFWYRLINDGDVTVVAKDQEKDNG